MTDPALVRQHPLFVHAGRKVVDFVSQRASYREWKRGQVIFRRGAVPFGLVLILGGRVRISREREGRRQVMHVETEGGTLGEVPVFDHQPMPATAVADTPVCAIIITPEVVRAAVALDPALGLGLLLRLSGRVRGLADQLERMTLHGVGMRLAAALLQRSRRSGESTLTLGITQEQFAEELGTVREVVVRELGRMVKAGILGRLGGGRFRLLDAEALRELALGEWNSGST